MEEVVVLTFVELGEIFTSVYHKMEDALKMVKEDFKEHNATDEQIEDVIETLKKDGKVIWYNGVNEVIVQVEVHKIN